MSVLFTSKVIFDEVADEYFVELPDELMKSLDWNIGDDLECNIEENGSILIRKI